MATGALRHPSVVRQNRSSGPTACQKGHPLSDEEAERLRSLSRYGLAERAEEVADEDLDLAARLLVHVTGASAGAVHIVDEARAVRVAAVGAPRGTRPRAESLCSEVMSQIPTGELLQSADAGTDPRLAQAGPTSGIGFYAVALLVGREGLPLGTVCAWEAAGSSPRVLSQDQQQAVLDLAAFVTRVLELRRRAAALEHDALHDPLTQLPNRRLLLDRLGQALARRRRVSGEPLVAMVDLVGFKAVNDEHGHAVGDQILVCAAARLQSVFRPEDTIARWGGDEFVVVAERLSTTTFEGILGRLRAAFDEPLESPSGHRLTIGVTVGSALGQAEEDAHQLIARADAAMYAHRRRQRR